jgi:hypothetical protein
MLWQTLQLFRSGHGLSFAISRAARQLAAAVRFQPAAVSSPRARQQKLRRANDD